MTNPEELGREPSLADVHPEIGNVLSSVEVSSDKDRELKIVAESVISTSFRQITEVKGYGVDGEGKKPFHDLAHTKEMIQDASEIFDIIKEALPQLKLTNRDKLLVLMVAASHDVEQDLGRVKNEEASADFLVSLLKGSTLYQSLEADGEIDAMRKLIGVTVFDPARHEQKFLNQDMNTKHDVLERVVALADLRALGVWSRQHWRGNRFFHELNSKSYSDADEAEKIVLVKRWQMGQIEVLSRQQEYLQTRFKDLPVQKIYPDLLKNQSFLETLSREIDDLVNRGISLDKIMSKRKVDTDEIKVALGFEP